MPARPEVTSAAGPFAGQLDVARRLNAERLPAGARGMLARRARFKEGDKDAVEAEMRGEDPSFGAREDIEGGPTSDAVDVVKADKEAVKRSSYRYVLGLMQPVPCYDRDDAYVFTMDPLNREGGIAPAPFSAGANLVWDSGCRS